MDDNKNLLKTREKSNADIRKMYPKEGANIGIKNGEKITGGKKFTKRSKLSHNV